MQKRLVMAQDMEAEYILINLVDTGLAALVLKNTKKEVKITLVNRAMLTFQFEQHEIGVVSNGEGGVTLYGSVDGVDTFIEPFQQTQLPSASKLIINTLIGAYIK